MRDYIIITDRDQLKDMIRELLSEITPRQEVSKSDYVNVDGLIAFLAKNGFKTSKSQIYKYTSSNQIPYLKVGNKLLFNRNDIIDWIESHKKTPKRTRAPIKIIQANMRESVKDS